MSGKRYPFNPSTLAPSSTPQHLNEEEEVEEEEAHQRRRPLHSRSRPLPLASSAFSASHPSWPPRLSLPLGYRLRGPRSQSLPPSRLGSSLLPVATGTSPQSAPSSVLSDLRTRPSPGCPLLHVNHRCGCRVVTPAPLLYSRRAVNDVIRKRSGAWWGVVPSLSLHSHRAGAGDPVGTSRVGGGTKWGGSSMSFGKERRPGSLGSLAQGNLHAITPCLFARRRHHIIMFLFIPAGRPISSIPYSYSFLFIITSLQALCCSLMATGKPRFRLLPPAAAISTNLSATFHIGTVLSFKHRMRRSISMSMNGCECDPRTPIGIVETRTLAVASTPSFAMDHLSSTIASLKASPPGASSGIIRLQVPIPEKIEAIDWLHSQDPLLPRCYFSRRSALSRSSSDLLLDSLNGHSNGNGDGPSSVANKLVSVAGIGSAVFFRHLRPFSFHDWSSIRRFLSMDSSLIRAYGAIRFDARSRVSAEWEPFGSFYFVVPQVEFDELEEGSALAATIAWDDSLSWTWQNAINSAEELIHKLSSHVRRLKRQFPEVSILSSSHYPDKTNWELAVNKILHSVRRDDSAITKVVLARSSKFVTDIDLDPVALLACLQLEGKDSYQFCIQPPNAPAFIGNTPEQLFRRSWLSISSEALAATRARGATKALDLQIEQELLSSPKDILEFSIVRDSIRDKLKAVCNSVVVEPELAVRKLPRVQHLNALVAGRLRSKDDEYVLLSSLHPTPAVCGFPMEDARDFIAKTEEFDRGMYAGPVGWFGGGGSEFAVGIRSALIEKGGKAFFYAGTGIVEGSNPCLEWKELEMKTSQFTNYLKEKVAVEGVSGIATSKRKIVN